MRSRHRSWAFASLSAVSLAGFPCLTMAQAGTQGIVAISVADASNALVPNADLQLTAIDTNVVRTSKTTSRGTFNFVDLPIGAYRLIVTHDGYATTVLESVVVHASQSTPVNVVLQVGSASESVKVDAAAVPLLDTTSNSLTSVIDLKAIENLPITGRDLTTLASLVPGYAAGSFSGQPLVNQGVNIDGVVGAASRAKYVGNTQASASPRVENIAEMAIGTDQIDLDQGFGRSSMQISYVTRSGTNQFHGRVYGDFRNAGLNANSYYNDALNIRKGKLIYNDFGGSLGGPIWKDKLFFFASVSTRRVPQQTLESNSYLSPAAQTGNLTYGTTTVNVLSLAASAGLPSTVNAQIAAQLKAINATLTSSSTGTTTNADPNVNTVSWYQPNPLIYYWPTARLDYNVSNKLHTYLTWNMSQETAPGNYAAPFPGPNFSAQASDYRTRSFTLGFGADYTITPSIVNQFKAGYLYTTNQYSPGADTAYETNPSIYWALGSSGQYYNLPVSNFYPVINVSDSIAWQKGRHSIKFGGGWNREQDHYWNSPVGFNNIDLGLVQGDPAYNLFNTSTLPGASSATIAEAQNLYATLVGRISYVGGSYAYDQKTGQYNNGISSYNLDERQSAGGFFIQDSWRARQTLTLNYGLRWDFTGDNYDLTGAYHSIAPNEVLGPSSSVFQPGVFGGTTNPTIDTRPHTYAPYYIAPQPQFGFAWNPSGEGPLGGILGKGDTVIRGGFSLKRFTMPQQYYWNNASSYGSFFFQNFYLNANNTGTAGTFAPGSLSLGSTLPSFGLSPANYMRSEAQSDFTFLNSQSFASMDDHIKQPYTESWNLGFERKFGARAVEVRYVGNRTLHQWVPVDLNEVNVFENGFLQQFKNAQANLAASGGKTFKGAQPTPIFDAAFAGEATGQYGHLDDYDNGSFTTDLQNGDVGSMASTLSSVYGTASYFCNLVGSSFAPCVNNAGFTGGGAGYATNFFQANPYAAGQSSSLMMALGYSNYNSLQIDFRQASWKGWTFDANYTYGKTLGVESTNSDYTGTVPNLYTIRNFGLGYGPSTQDERHALHFTSTYDLPFGRGKMFLNSNNLASRLLGNWTVGSIMRFTSGLPTKLTGGNTTYNDYADGGVDLNGISAKTLQKAVGVHRTPGTYYATLLDSKYLVSAQGTGGPNTTFINPHTTPGTFGQFVYLYGPHAFSHDLSLSKAFPIFRRFQFRFQGEFLNAWNHPTWGGINGATNSTSFGVGTVNNTPRVIELRANIEF